MGTIPTRVLLVEDNPGDALLLKAALAGEQASSYVLERVELLKDALDRLAKGGLDLILLDLFLPDSSGLDTLKSIQEAAFHIPTIVLTGLKDGEIAMRALKEGAQDFLVKDGLDGALLKRSISYSIERHQLLEKLREKEERYFLVAMGSHDGLWDWDLKTGQVYFSPRWKLMLGYLEDEVGSVADEWFRRVHPQDMARVRQDLSEHLSGKTPHFANEHRLRHKDGRYRWVLSRGLAIREGGKRPARIAGSFTDIQRHKSMEKQLALRAYYDPLTGLPNRILFMDALDRAFARLRRRPQDLMALFFLDLDRLKFVNDSMGHQAGDALLIEFAKRLRVCVRPRDLVARMSGDEFTILLEDLQDRSEAIGVADRILDSWRAPFLLGERTALTTASIGIAYSDHSTVGPEELLKAADSAMYEAKVTGKARYTIHGQESEQKHQTTRGK
jgi:diguanylate cyclase (GGDEF)-like protein/PAS domain S-box-containing protein